MILPEGIFGMHMKMPYTAEKIQIGWKIRRFL